ncbi:hypothetical protein ACP4OV_017128 [Aristida adscensionis]
MAPPAASHPKAAAGPNPKHYIVAALAATLGAAVVVTVSFMVLSPARVRFSVAYAGCNRPSGDGAVELRLTLAANNTSRRAAVRYESMFVDVRNSTAAAALNWISAEVTTPMPLGQPRESVVSVDAAVLLVPGPVRDGFTGNLTSDSLAVVVTAAVRFRVGLARTRLYDIKVTCAPVDFFAAADAAGARHGGTRPRLPVQCV